MPLQKQTIPIALAMGLDTQSDPKQLAPGSMLELENARFRKGGRIHKRYGYDALLPTVEGGGQVPPTVQPDGTYAASGMFAFGNELLQFSGRRVYSYAPGSARWNDKGAASSVSSTTRTIVRSDTLQEQNPDSATGGGFECYLFEEAGAVNSSLSRPGVSYAVTDQATGARVVTDTRITGVSSFNTGAPNVVGSPRVVATPTGFLLFYVEAGATTGTLKVRAVTYAQPGVLGPELVVAQGLWLATLPYDAVWLGSQCIVVASTGPSPSPAIVTWLTASGAVTAQASNAALTGETCLDMTTAGGVRALVTIASATSKTLTVSALSLSSPGAAPEWQTSMPGAPTLVPNWQTGATPTGTPPWAPVRVTSAYVPLATAPLPPIAGPASASSASVASINAQLGQVPGVVTFIECISPPGITYYPPFSAAQFEMVALAFAPYAPGQTAASTPQGPVASTYSVGLASKAFVYGGLPYVGLVYASAYQSTYFLSDARGQVVARGAPGLAGGYRLGTQLPAVSQVTPTAFQFAAEVKGRLQSASNIGGSSSTTGVQAFTLLGVQRLRFDFGSATSYVGGYNARCLVLTGGFASVYDGAQAVEHNFHLYPDGVQLSPGASSTGLLVGAYQYIATYEWTDALGQVVRSTTSITASMTTTAGAQTNYVYVPFLSLSAKQNVRVCLYRTEANGTLFYHAATIQNNPAQPGVVVLDALPDAQLIANDILYTAGSVLDHMPFPACRCMTSHQGRLFVSGLEDPTEIRFSNLTGYGSTCDANDLLSVRIDPRWGTVVALESMDSYLLIFTDKAVLSMSGDGPDATGSGTFSTPQLLSSDAGCVNVNSVVRTPQGVMFQGQKGLMVVSSGSTQSSGYLSVSFAGGPVEAYTDAGLTITAATLVPAESEVRFMTRDGACLVYSYLYSQWSVYTGLASVDADVWQGRYVCLRPDARTYIENTSRFDDNGALVRIRLRTGWLSLAGLQQVQRVYRLLVLGDYKSTHSLSVSLAYDFVAAPLPAAVINADLAQTATAFGVGGDATSSYGSQSPYGGLPQPYQYRIQTARQKCEALQVTIEESQPSALAVSGAYGEGLNLSSLALEVGAKQQMAKSGRGSSYGA